jgi:hypothetical protein
MIESFVFEIETGRVTFLPMHSPPSRLNIEEDEHLPLKVSAKQCKDGLWDFAEEIIKGNLQKSWSYLVYYLNF